MEKVYEKLNRAEIEHKRLQLVANSCFKNPARNDEWVRGLEKAIENIINLIDAEQTDIESNHEESAMLENEMKNL
jgi:hypothetical protein